MRDLDTIVRYHERTKHHLNRYARSLGYLDWKNQPDPFRRYEGASVRALELLLDSEGPTYDSLFETLPDAAPLSKHSVSALLFDSLSLSAWKSMGKDRWSLRVNPSSGNLHPTEAYLLAGPIEGLHDAAALYHYAPFPHALELRAELASQTWNDLSSDLPKGAFFVGLSSIPWREAWKYGERAFRYCQHDVGHALAALSLAAAMQGWVCRLIEGIDDAALATLFGISGQQGDEREHPDGLLVVHPAAESMSKEGTFLFPSAFVEAMRAVRLQGKENRLSSDHHPWPIIEEVATAAAKQAPAAGLQPASSKAAPSKRAVRSVGARALVRKRRSAVAMDGESVLDRDEFFHMLLRLVPPGLPFEVLPWPPEVHIMLLVHRVHDVEPGLYALVRNPDHERAVRVALDDAFLWQEPAGCPPGLHLRMLMPADVRDLARTLSCHQEIASDGVFSVAMVARFRAALEERGPWYYRRLFWETGILGQVLYLEAEAAGLAGTGIGCFFDDAVHQVLGIRDDGFQSLYHFTVGGRVEDPRLRTAAAYEHLKG
jgi:SagB-type dehydrogenase family enzyme